MFNSTGDRNHETLLECLSECDFDLAVFTTNLVTTSMSASSGEMCDLCKIKNGRRNDCVVRREKGALFKEKDPSHLILLNENKFIFMA